MTNDGWTELWEPDGYGGLIKVEDDKSLPPCGAFCGTGRRNGQVGHGLTGRASA